MNIFLLLSKYVCESYVFESFELDVISFVVAEGDVEGRGWNANTSKNRIKIINKYAKVKRTSVTLIQCVYYSHYENCIVESNCKAAQIICNSMEPEDIFKENKILPRKRGRIFSDLLHILKRRCPGKNNKTNIIWILK